MREQTIKALAGHVSRQTLERYSHIRSEAKQAAIQVLDGQAIAPIVKESRYSFRYISESADNPAEANSQKTNGGPARIRTWDQRIMSSPEGAGAEEDKPLSPAKQGKVRQKLQPGRNRDAGDETV